ncbi:hypothetical protein BaRGS_00023606 [Batillaria attramentaria]|uniref:STI1 domain-containing protein n=1 Tax=Batillaria attramentaria TaxID=370345 RepID=A0ABD0KDV5_9CAEN
MADSDIPPLDDMTEMLQQAKQLRDLKLARTGGGDTERPKPPDSRTTHQCHDSAKLQNGSEISKTSHHTKAASSSPKQPQTDNTAKLDASKKSTTPQAKQKSDFAGMKKGFLFGSPKANSSSNSKSQTSETKPERSKPSDASGQSTESIPFIKPKSEEKDSSLKLTEVQEAMESASGLLKDKEWVTDDLLQKVQNNEVLAQRMKDPRFMQAIAEFQTNPQTAMAKYQSNPEVQRFLKEFCGILGEHFTTLGDKDGSSQTQPPRNQTGPKIMEVGEGESRSAPMTGAGGSQVPVDPHVQQILSDPANQEILMDPKIQMLIQHLRSNPEKAQRMLRESDDSFRQKVDRLIALGLLKFQA